MFNFWDAFTYIFKEKDWELKFLLPFALQLLIVAPSTLLSGMFQAQPAQTLYLNTGATNMMSYSYSPTASIFGLAYLCIFLISFIPYIVVNLWYIYENTQAGIYNRETKAIWKNRLNDTLKKGGKYLINNFVYEMIFFLIAAIVVIIFSVIFGALGILGLAVLRSSSMTSYTFPGIAGSGIGLFLICILSIVAIIFVVAAYMWMTTGSLRLIATNTFEEGVKLRENWAIAMRHKWKFVELMITVFLGVLVIGVFSVTFSLFTSLLGDQIPFLSLVLKLLTQIALGLITTYLAFFVYPRLLGQFFRSVIKDEKALHFIKL